MRAPGGLPKSRRLLRPEEFAAVMKGGRRSRDEFFTMFVLANTLAHGRIGLSVSRRASPKAVARNRIKRQARESFRAHQRGLAGIDVVVVAHAAAAAAENRALRDALRQHWQKLAQSCKKS